MYLGARIPFRYSFPIPMMPSFCISISALDGCKVLLGQSVTWNRATRRSSFCCPHVQQRQQARRVLLLPARSTRRIDFLNNVAYIGVGAALGAHSRLFLRDVQGVLSRQPLWRPGEFILHSSEKVVDSMLYAFLCTVCAATSGTYLQAQPTARKLL